MSSHACLTLFAVAAITLAGCGKSPSVKTYPISGTVTYNGKPLAGANVTYSSKASGTYAATAVTEPDGRFSLATYVSPREVYKGAVPGNYEVTITKQTAEAKQNTTSSVAWENLSDKERAENMTKMWEKQNDGGKNEPKAQKPTSEIPLKYANSETSGLTATVVVGENEPREFKLTDE